MKKLLFVCLVSNVTVIPHEPARTVWCQTMGWITSLQVALRPVCLTSQFSRGFDSKWPGASEQEHRVSLKDAFVFLFCIFPSWWTRYLVDTVGDCLVSRGNHKLENKQAFIQRWLLPNEQKPHWKHFFNAQKWNLSVEALRFLNHTFYDACFYVKKEIKKSFAYVDLIVHPVCI